MGTMKITMAVALLFFVSLSAYTVTADAVEESQTELYRNKRDANVADGMRSHRDRCVSCSVNGQLYDGHSRFQYEEGCNRFRCICRCDGSYECPAKHSENICKDSRGGSSSRTSSSSSRSSSSSTSSSSHSTSSSSSNRRGGRCKPCVVKGKEHPGHAYFKHVEGCVTMDCICYCNGTYVCPPNRARNTCTEGDASVSSGQQSGSSSSSSQTSSTSYSRTTSYNVSVDSARSGEDNQRGRGSSMSSREREREEARRRAESRRQNRGCQTCSVDGQEFKGNAYFELQQGCAKFRNCICYCNGTWNCPERFAQNTCTTNDTSESGSRETQSTCRMCTVKGQTFSGNNYFEITDGCLQYKNCLCSCNGSWSCPDDGATNICTGGEGYDVEAADCQKCEVNGKTFPGNKYFETRDGCIEYKNCICRCDGSWTCPHQNATNTCLTSGGGEVDESGCRTCEVYGSSFPGNDYFQVRHGCIEYTNCVCRCDGSWTCPDNSAKNICSRGAGTPGISGNGETKLSVSGCSDCYVYGKYFKGGDYFDVINGCLSYRNCICRCDGSWDCSDRYTTNICNNETRRETTDRATYVERTQTRGRETVSRETTTPRASLCRSCNAKDKVVDGNSYFEMTDGCVEYKNCLCRCDGSWECPPQYAKNICLDPSRSSLSNRGPTGCVNCLAKGKIVRGNSNFELIDGCTRFTSCSCKCDGQWECLPESSQNICFNNSTSSDDACSLCKSSDGKLHPPNREFQLQEGCIEYNCDCFCNGSWSCPGKKSRWTCADKCLQCDVNGRKVENNTVFTHKTGCLEYTCNCYCNGSWSCPGKSVRNTCPVGVQDNCNKCVVSPTEKYEGESDFVLKQGCLHYKCRCNCDGSYTCPGKEARNVCRGEQLGGCRSCVISETEIHQGNTDFSMRRECIHYKCRCNCDGSWECPKDNARNVCLGEVPGGCRVCRVSDNEVYRANSVFDLRKGCISYKCRCNCDGGWTCPGEDARDVCKGEVPGGCRSCILSDNEFYPGNTNFEMVKDCIHYKCRCNCDGGYSCPGRTARRVCQTGDAPETPDCRRCRVSDTEQFAGNTTFQLSRGCYRYECGCNCDGSWECPPEKTQNGCTDSSNQVATPARCEACKIGREVFPGDSTFKFTRRCYQFDCNCNCKGRWSCDHKNPTNICKERQREASVSRTLSTSRTSSSETRKDITASNQLRSQPSEQGTTFAEVDIRSQDGARSGNRQASRTNRRTTERSNTRYTTSTRNCIPCQADGRVIQPNQPFGLDRGCLQYRNCQCNCNGRWQCAEEINRCEGSDRDSAPSLPRVRNTAVSRGEKTYGSRTRTSSGSSTTKEEVEQSAWVYVDGMDTSHVKTGDSKTGGGYMVQVDTRYSPFYTQVGHSGKRLARLETRPSSSISSPDTASSSRTISSSSIQSSTSLSSSQERNENPNKGISQCSLCEVDTRTYPAGAHFDMRRGCVVYKCTCMCSGSYRCRLTSDNACSPEDKKKTCSNCVYQGMVYPGNMGFTVRDGCIEKQCQCSCDGTHTCPTTKPIPGCTAETAHSPGPPAYGNFFPIYPGLQPASRGHITNTGRAVYTAACPTCTGGGTQTVYHTPVHPASGGGGSGFSGIPGSAVNFNPRQANGACADCSVDGQTRAGNSTFTFVKDCIEFDCYCACGGSWKCAGRLSLDCAPGFAPDAVPHNSECRSCLVQGTEFPPNARFSLRQGCYEYKCSCNCDGGWSCPAQHPNDLCPTAPSGPERGSAIDPQSVTEDTYFTRQGFSSEVESRVVGELRQSFETSDRQGDTPETCLECQVRGVTYPSKTKFFLRDGCIQRLCDCHCNSTWSCSQEDIVDICKMETSDGQTIDGRECKDCTVGEQVFKTEKKFEINWGCYHNKCFCHCNGTHSCPEHRLLDTCKFSNDAPHNMKSQSDNTDQSALLKKKNDEIAFTGTFGGCKPCEMEGQTVAPLLTVVRKRGCFETICHCQCNGQPSCPPSASVNVCKLPDKKPMSERKGCEVGRRTFFTRVFPHVEDCLERTCVCHDDGTWDCKRSEKDRKVC